MMRRIRIKITRIDDLQKTGSTLHIGKVIEAESFPRKPSEFYWEDLNGQQWIFHEGKTCEIVEDAIDPNYEEPEQKYFAGYASYLDGKDYDERDYWD